ncbi:MAG: phage distal tail protein [Gemmatimonadaceae bacterium]
MTWKINGTDPRAAYGLVVEQVTGWLDAAQEKYPSVRLPNGYGEALLSTAPQVEARRLVARGVVRGSSAADARAKLDALRALFTKGRGKTPLAVVLDDAATRQYNAVCESFAAPPPPASTIARDLPVEIALVCPDPYAYDTAQTSTGITATTAMPLGTGPVRPVITLTFTAATVNPQLQFFEAVGSTTIGLVGATGTFQTTDTIVIDCARRTLTLNGLPRIDLLLGDFPLLDVATQGDYATSAWPRAVRNLTTFAATVAYAKAWR